MTTDGRTIDGLPIDRKGVGGGGISQSFDDGHLDPSFVFQGYVKPAATSPLSPVHEVGWIRWADCGAVLLTSDDDDARRSVRAAILDS